MTWDAQFEKSDSGWQVYFDFAHEGSLSLVCSEVSFVVSGNAAPPNAVGKQ